MNRKQRIAGAILLDLLIILCIAGSILALNEWESRQGIVAQREPLPGFGYCSASQSRPCILSFNSNPDGTMAINILAKGYSEDFYVKIRHAEDEHIYTCKKDEKYSIHVSCTGEALPVGETLSFLVISTGDNSVLAEGSFPIIGIALATPEIRITPTPISVFDNLPK